VDKLTDETPPVEMPTPPVHELLADSQGFMIRGLPVAGKLPLISRVGGYLRYVPLQYHHCYIDFGMSFEDYQKKFSSKTRSTINRKIRKYSEHCNGAIPWKTYQLPDEMQDFFRLARTVSKLTYQERLLDAGIPDSADFIRDAESLAADGRVRAYILFDGERPVSYLYCPIEDGVLNYAYLGYDPEYMQLSVGTVLQWLAVEQLFNEGRFRYFDFLEGQGDHKRLFATHQRQCANVFLVKANLRNTLVVYGQLLMGSFSKWLGAFFERIGLKAKIKKFFRFRM
jgi:CelD/BcsL family acetyltransferase involved in cellulose biosynthesis